MRFKIVLLGTIVMLNESDPLTEYNYSYVLSERGCLSGFPNGDHGKFVSEIQVIYFYLLML